MAGGHSGVSDLAGRVSTAANVGYWAVIVKDKSLLRQMITENTPMGNQMRVYLDEALGAAHLDVESSRLKGRYISLIYSVRHASSILEQFEQ